MSSSTRRRPQASHSASRSSPVNGAGGTSRVRAAVAPAAFFAGVVGLVFTPYWQGLSLLGYVPWGLVVLLLAGLAALVVRPVREGRLVPWDLVLAAVVVLVLALARLSEVLRGHSFVLVTQWVGAYAVGRVIASRTNDRPLARILVVVMAAVAGLAVLEFLSGWNPYLASVPDTEQYTVLGEAQVRGGVVRSEWAMGHSIALGNALAMSAPLVLFVVRRTSTRLLLLTMLVAGIAVTFSRSAYATLVIGLVLAVLFGQHRFRFREHAVVLAVAAASAMLLGPTVRGVFESAVEETARSAEHRRDLVDMVGLLRPFGTANQYSEVGGVFNWDGVVSIDNAFLRTAVNFGWVVAAIFMVGYALVALRVMSKHADGFALTLVAVFPALFTFSLITQFGMYFWLLVGVAVTYMRSPKHRPPRISSSRLRATERPQAGR